jgi:hypothetical protein
VRKPHAGPVLSLSKESVRGLSGNWQSYHDDGGQSPEHHIMITITSEVKVAGISGRDVFHFLLK